MVSAAEREDLSTDTSGLLLLLVNVECCPDIVVILILQLLSTDSAESYRILILLRYCWVTAEH